MLRERGIKTDGVQNGEFSISIFFWNSAFWYPFILVPFECLFSSTQKGIKTDGFQNCKFFEFWKLVCWCPFILVPVLVPQIFESSESVRLPWVVLRTTARISQRNPHIPRYGVWGVSTWTDWVQYPSGMRNWGAISPCKRGILAMLAWYHTKARPKMRCFLCVSKGIARYGGVCRTGPLKLASQTEGLTSGKVRGTSLLLAFPD